MRDEDEITRPLTKFRKKSRSPEGSPRIYSRGMAVIWERDQKFFIIPLVGGGWIFFTYGKGGGFSTPGEGGLDYLRPLVRGLVISLYISYELISLEMLKNTYFYILGSARPIL